MTKDDKADHKKDWTQLAAEETTETPEVELEEEAVSADNVDMQALQAKVNEHWELVLRTRADLENVRRRHQTELEKERAYSIAKFVTELLLVVDSLEHGLVACAEGDKETVAALRQGMELTLKVLRGVFEKFSVKTIDPIGQPFDPSYHEAIGMNEEKDVAPGTVLMVMQKGYQLHDRVLRPARVIVAKQINISE